MKGFSVTVHWKHICQLLFRQKCGFLSLLPTNWSCVFENTRLTKQLYSFISLILKENITTKVPCFDYQLDLSWKNYYCNNCVTTINQYLNENRTRQYKINISLVLFPILIWEIISNKRSWSDKWTRYIENLTSDLTQTRNFPQWLSTKN